MVKISQAELEIMNVIWHNTQPISVSEIISLLDSSKPRKYTTVATFISRLKDKGFLECKKNGSINEYYAAVTEEEYRRIETKEFIDSVYNGSSKGLIASLCSERLSKDDFDELMRWIEERDL